MQLDFIAIWNNRGYTEIMDDDLFSALMQQLGTQVPHEHKAEIIARMSGASPVSMLFVDFASQFAEAALGHNEKRYMDISMAMLFLSGLLPEMMPSGDDILDASDRTWDAFTEGLQAAVDPDQFLS